MCDSRAKGPELETRSGHLLSFLLPLIQEEQQVVSKCRKYDVHLVLVGGLSLPRNSVVRLIDRPDMAIDVIRLIEILV